MSAEGGSDAGMEAAAARLRHLLSEVDGVRTIQRSEPGCQRQIDVCAEIEAIVRARIEARAA